MARRKSTRKHDGTCSYCGWPRDRPNQRYCRDCHAGYMRAFRPKHSELTPEQRLKSNCRAYANLYQRRGKLIPKPCEVCGGEAEKHHPDYSKPLEVRWLCRVHHAFLHATTPPIPAWDHRPDGPRAVRELIEQRLSYLAERRSKPLATTLDPTAETVLESENPK